MKILVVLLPFLYNFFFCKILVNHLFFPRFSRTWVMAIIGALYICFGIVSAVWYILNIYDFFYSVVFELFLLCCVYLRKNLQRLCINFIFYHFILGNSLSMLQGHNRIFLKKQEELCYKFLVQNVIFHFYPLLYMCLAAAKFAFKKKKQKCVERKRSALNV